MPKKRTRTNGRASKRARPEAPSSPPRHRPRPETSTTIQLPRLLTVSETAEILRTTPKAVYCLIERGELPGVIRLSRRILVDGSKLVDWLDQNRAVSLHTQGEQR